MPLGAEGVCKAGRQAETAMADYFRWWRWWDAYSKPLSIRQAGGECARSSAAAGRQALEGRRGGGSKTSQ